MKLLPSTPAQLIRLATALFIGVVLISGCSSSGNPSTGATDGTAGDVTADDVTGETTSDTTTGSAAGTTTVVPDPMVQNTTQVNFDITVPAYQSNELKIGLLWGDKEINAMWVGDESWSASSEFASNTEQPLVVTFYDQNGDLILGVFETSFKIGVNTAEDYQITADQFDLTQFDSDGDGVTNFAEGIAGTDPLNDEDALLDVNDYFVLSAWSRMSVSQSFESRVSAQRPFSDTFQLEQASPDHSEWLGGNVDIDTNGNGTLTYEYLNQPDRLNLTGTRTNSGSAISWEGVRRAYDGDYSHGVDFTNTVAVVDESTRSFVEQITGYNVGTYDYRWETSTSLTGKLVDGTSLCEPVAGTVSNTFRTRPGGKVETTTISKAIGDRYWRVVYETTEDVTREYFARNLRIFSVSLALVPEDAYFKCDFVDI